MYMYVDVRYGRGPGGADTHVIIRIIIYNIIRARARPSPDRVRGVRVPVSQ
jgi:hypothetical protein